MLLFARGGGVTGHFCRFEAGKNERTTRAGKRVLIEHLLRLSEKAVYWVMLEVTMLIFQSSPDRI